jgi:hypothetical protein
VQPPGGWAVASCGSGPAGAGARAVVEENQQQVQDYEKKRKENPEEFDKDVVDITPPRPECRAASEQEHSPPRSAAPSSN